MAQSTGKSISSKTSAAPLAPPSKVATAKPKSAPAKTVAAREPTKVPAKKASPRTAPAKGNGETPVSAKAAVKKAPAKRQAVPRSIGGVSPEQRYRMICDAAYFRAERRGFVGGNAVQDWLDAEAEIDDLLREMQH